MGRTRLSEVQTVVSPNYPDKCVYLSDEFRNLGTHIVGASGSGKSMLTGRYIITSDFGRKIPQVVFDNGDSIDHFLYQISTWKNPDYSRIRYVDMSGMSGYVTPFPFYHQFKNETDYQIASRFPDLIRKIAPALEAAQVQGFPPLEYDAQTAGVELVKRGWQITEMEQLIDPKQIAETLKVRLLPFRLDPIQRAMYGASQPGIDWKQVIERGETVLLDFRNCIGTSSMTLALQWAFFFITELMQSRGIGATPFGIVIDELYDFTGSNVSMQNAFVHDLVRLRNVKARRYNIWLTLAHQEMNQFMDSPALQKSAPWYEYTTRRKSLR